MIELDRANEDTTFQSVDDEDDSIIKSIKNPDSEKWAKIYYLFKNISSLKKDAEEMSSSARECHNSCRTLNNQISNLIGDLKNGGEEKRRKRIA